ncbi:MAG: C25 family cysteine peptidase [Vicinamibacteria bacterium]
MLSLAVLCARPDEARAQACNDSLPTGTLAGVINTYYPGVGTVAAGATVINVDILAIRGAATPIVAGDMLLVIQMQEADFNTTNTNAYGANAATGSGYTALNDTGRYEYVVAQSLALGVLTIRGAGTGNGLLNTYVTAARDDTGGTRTPQRTFQVVRVSRRATATLGATLTAAAWDGRTGGILAFDVAGALTLGGVTASVSGLGFRGGVGQSLAGDGDADDADYRLPQAENAHGRKGEGFACTPASLTGVPGATGTDGCVFGDRARGAPGNGGGGGTDDNPGTNDENSGGGGGGNGGAGGIGGNAWNTSAALGGRGGVAFPALTTRLVMGGGGGAGVSNNVGPAHGANGGGMVFIRTGSVTGSGTLNVSGASAVCSGQDGAGAGGAGGSVMVYTASGTWANLTVNAAGGVGGDADFNACNVSNSPHGPGGGGGGGVVFSSSGVNGASSVAGGASGRTTGNIAFGSAAGSNGVLTTTLTVTQIPGVQACTVATRASVAGLRVGPGVVEFATASQRGTLAFEVFATDDPHGLANRRPLARRVPAALPDTTDAVLYRVPVALRQPGPYVVIDEIEISGHVRRLGPFAAGDGELADAYARLAERASREETRSVRGATMLTGRALTPPAAWRDAARIVPSGGEAVSAVKVETRGAGTATVAFADLVTAGLPPAVLKTPSVLRVSRLGRPVTSTLVPAGSPTAISFEAEPLETDFTDRAPYVVWYGRTAPPEPQVAFTRSGPPLPSGWLRVQQNLLYAPFVHPAADPWIWDFLLTGQPPLVKTFALPPLVPGGDSVAVAVHLSGSSAHPHAVQASLNGVRLGQAVFEGRTTGVVRARFPRALLREGDNELTLTYRAKGVADGDVGVAFVDAVDLGVQPSPVKGQTAQVARVVAYDPRLPRLEDVDYLVVTHQDFAAAAERLAGLHQREGLQTAVVDVARAYDALAGGAVEATAVRGMLGRLPVRKDPPAAVLFGDDTLDPRDYLGLGSVAYVPTLSGWDGQFGRVASENRYADQDGDGSPDLAIGRLPADSAAAAGILVDKIERGSPAFGPDARQVVAVDDQGPSDLSFEGLGERVVPTLPLEHVKFAQVSSGIENARAALLEGWRSEPLVVQYFGHGGADTWADERLLTNADAASLDGIGPAPFVFTWTCQAQWYQYHLGPSVNESLLLVPNGGALVTVGPSGISDPGLQSQLAEGVLRRLARGATIGQAVREAKAELVSQTPDARGVVEGFTLLGDPALVLGGAPPSLPGARAEER